TACAGVALRCSQLRGRHAVILPGLGEDRQGLLSGLGCVKACGLEVQELLVDGLGFARGGLLQRGLRPLTNPRRLQQEARAGPSQSGTTPAAESGSGYPQGARGPTGALGACPARPP